MSVFYGSDLFYCLLSFRPDILHLFLFFSCNCSNPLTFSHHHLLLTLNLETCKLLIIATANNMRVSTESTKILILSCYLPISLAGKSAQSIFLCFSSVRAFFFRLVKLNFKEPCLETRPCETFGAYPGALFSLEGS